MAMRGTKYPRPKLLYIAKDANREAAALGLPFGRLSDSVGNGVERCMAVFYYALKQKKTREFLWAVGQATFAKGIDVADDEGMQIVAQKSGLFWPEVAEAMKDESWRQHDEKNCADLYEYGLWGVPSFRIGNVAVWGQDRHWLLARKIEDLCAGGEGIVE
jgi:2-hydroxychromene-2-carboxylate isomerase